MSTEDCFLFTDNPSLIEDVATALSVLGIKLMSSSDTEEIKEWCLSSAPKALLIYLSGKTAYQPAIELASDLKSHWKLKKIPLIALVEREKEGIFKANQDLFNGFLNLPVEFPSFSRKLSTYLHIKEQAKTQVSRSGEYEKSVNEKLGFLSKAYAQLVERLKEDKAFSSLSLYESLQRAAELFKLYCAEIANEELRSKIKDKKESESKERQTLKFSTVEENDENYY
ncbi:MAG: hypothetical protein D6780_08255 [Candidatus Dadabacteria bacterium]|nr:MAG: hypothetical protein D6780_08255 [Candidatus Dadabacteria bacterium]